MPAKKKTALKRTPKKAPAAKSDVGDTALFDRVASILEQAHAKVVRAVNSNMVLAYRLIGREIVQEIQGGGDRAAYRKQVLGGLSRRLTERFGPGFSETTLKSFQTFYLAYANRRPLGDDFPPALPDSSHSAIGRPLGAELVTTSGKSDPAGSELLVGFSNQSIRFAFPWRPSRLGGSNFFKRLHRKAACEDTPSP